MNRAKKIVLQISSYGNILLSWFTLPIVCGSSIPNVIYIDIHQKGSEYYPQALYVDINIVKSWKVKDRWGKMNKLSHVFFQK